MIRKIWDAWKAFAKRLGDFNSRVVLTLFYFLIVGLISILIARWKDVLRRRCPKESNWLPVSSKEMDLSGARRQG